MNAQVRFDSMLKDVIYPILRPFGYRLRGQTFRLHRNGCWGVINFQKSDANSRDRVKFTVNIGVASELLLLLESRDGTIPKSPTEPDCQWRHRIGDFLPAKRDQWWVIESDTDITELAKAMVAHVQEIAIPEVEKHLGDGALRDHFLTLSNKTTSFGNSEIVIYLLALLKSLGPKNLFQQILDEHRERIEKDGYPGQRWMLRRVLADQTP